MSSTQVLDVKGGGDLGGGGSQHFYNWQQFAKFDSNHLNEWVLQAELLIKIKRDSSPKNKNPLTI